MEIKFKTDEMKSAIDAVMLIVSTSTRDILKMIYCAAYSMSSNGEDGFLILRGFNEAQWISVTIPCVVSQPGEYLLPGKHLQKCIAAIATVSTNTEARISSKNGLKLLAGKSKLELKPLPTAEYPIPPNCTPTADSIACSIGDPLKFLNVAAGFTSNISPAYAGVLVESKQSSLQIRSCDNGRTVFRSILATDSTTTVDSIVIPGGTAQVAQRLFRGTDSIEVGVADGWLRMHSSRCTLLTRTLKADTQRLSQGIDAILGLPLPNSAIVPITGLEGAIAMLSIYVDGLEVAPPINFTFANGELTAQAQSQIGHGVADIPCQVSESVNGSFAMPLQTLQQIVKSFETLTDAGFIRLDFGFEKMTLVARFTGIRLIDGKQVEDCDTLMIATQLLPVTAAT